MPTQLTRAQERLLRWGVALTYALAIEAILVSTLWLLRWVGRGLALAGIALFLGTLVALLFTGRALARSGPPFEQIRWWWPWGRVKPDPS